MTDSPLEQALIKTLLDDRKKDRRWRNVRFFVIVFFALIYTLIFMSLSSAQHRAHYLDPSKGYVSLVRLDGAIMPNKPFSALHVIPELTRAFADKEAKGVVLVINSPGGSPVQAAIIHDKIMQLKKKYNKQVIVLGEDALASGAYLVATAADKIYVNNDRLTGSIGVIMSGVGFTDAIKKIGVTRRVFTAGSNKDRLDPFEPVSDTDKEKIAQTLKAAHKSFIQYVQNGRKNKLKADPNKLFSGDFWLGSQAVKLGLADGTANLWNLLQDNFKVDQYKDYTHHTSMFEEVFEQLQSKLHLSLGQSIALKSEL